MLMPCQRSTVQIKAKSFMFHSSVYFVWFLSRIAFVSLSFAHWISSRNSPIYSIIKLCLHNTFSLQYQRNHAKINAQQILCNLKQEWRKIS